MTKATRPAASSRIGWPAGRRLCAFCAQRQPGVHLRPHRQTERRGLGWPARLGHGHGRSQDRHARGGHRSAGHAAGGGGRLGTGALHRQGSEPCQPQCRLHRSAPGDQWRQRTACRRVWRGHWVLRAPRIRPRAVADGRVRQDRTHRRSRAKTASGATRAFASAIVVCLAVVAAALVLQLRFNIQPCPWCGLQRAIFIAIALAALPPRTFLPWAATLRHHKLHSPGHIGH